MTRKSREKEARRPVTLQDIADRCGVSRITASCALRGDRKNVSQAVMDRIVRMAQRMGYDPTLAYAARRLKYQHSPGHVANHLVALFFPVFSERYWTLIFQGINEALQEEHYGLLLSSVDPRHSSLREQLPYVFRRGEVDGVLIFAREDCEDLAKGLADEPGFGSRPLVTLTERLPGRSAVLVDDFRAGYLAAAHLLDLGHRHLMCFHLPDRMTTITQHRIEGHEQAMRDRQIDPQTCLHHAPWVWDDPRGLDVVMPEILQSHPSVTALLCPSDGFGIPLARTLHRLGRRVPEDMSLVGVDDSDELLDARDQNIWTTVRLPLRDLGAESARLLMRRIKGEASSGTVITLPVSLVVRGSTCPPKTA